MNEGPTTAVIDGFLHELAGAGGDVAATEPIVGALLNRAVRRLHALCASLLYRGYPRLTRPPLNLQVDEMLGAVVERLIKAMREARPRTVREFFALATRHMRWELNDMARLLDARTPALPLHESRLPQPPDDDSLISVDGLRILEAIEGLPEEVREAFDLVRIQGVPQTEAAEILGVATKTVQRRLNRAVLLLTEQLGDLRPAAAADRSPPDEGDR